MRRAGPVVVGGAEMQEVSPKLPVHGGVIARIDFGPRAPLAEPTVHPRSHASHVHTDENTALFKD